MKRIPLLLSVLSFFSGASAPGAAQIAPVLASVQGQVVTPDNKAVTGAEVAALGGAAPRITKSGADGSFRFTGLPAGTYFICVQNQPGLLNPCPWSAAQTGVAVKAGESVTGVVVRMLPSKTFSIRVNDPNHLIAAHEGKTDGAYLMIGVWTPAHLFVSAQVASSDSGGRTYTIELPPGVSVRPGVHSKAFKFLDSAGKSFSPDLALASITPSATTQSLPLAVSISGIAVP